MIRYYWILLALGCQSAIADTPLFASDQVLAITIEAPLRALLNDRAAEPDYRPAQLRYVDGSGTTHSFDIKLRPRGKNRRKRDVCRFPPLRLNFQTRLASGTVFEGQDKLKLVTHCQDNKKSYQQYLLQEYLVYKTLNLLTERSFRARLLNVTYVSTDSNRKPLTSYGFFIEDRGHMAARNGLEHQSVQRIERHQLDPESANLIEIFQYLIGNTDWSALRGADDDRCCHNAVLIGSDDGAMVPVPYDFDYAGIIGTPTAAPAPGIRIKNVRTRVYRGYCRPSNILDYTLTLFRQKRNDIYALYQQQVGLSPGVLKKTRRYLDSFYSTIDDPNQLERRIVDACR